MFVYQNRVSAKMVSMSSPLNFFKIVVFPALSKPKTNSRTSFSFSFNFFSMVSNPMFALNSRVLRQHVVSVARYFRTVSVSPMDGITVGVNKEEEDIRGTTISKKKK